MLNEQAKINRGEMGEDEMSYLKSGDPVLDEAAQEFRRTGNIDVFNNMVTFAAHPDIWREIGTPKEITGDLYRVSPFAAHINKLAKESLKK